MSSSIFDMLPGSRMAISEVTKTVSKMWQENPDAQGVVREPSLFRASQMNLVLHLGLRTLPEKAHQLFNCCVTFAQKYPCRIIVICPEKGSGQKKGLRGKLFSRCYLGEDLRDTCCCEALTLGYQIEDVDYLESQVSLWLEGDLPTYYWFNEVSVDAIKEKFLSHIKSHSKVLYDSRVEPPEFKSIAWPEPESLYDLATARLQPVRQSLGQFLSAYRPLILVQGLKKVVIRHEKGYGAEAESLLEWQKECLMNCASVSSEALKAEFSTIESKDAKHCLELDWSYEAKNKFFGWWYCDDIESGSITANFGKETISYPLQIKKLPPEEVLAEAIFF